MFIQTVFGVQRVPISRINGARSLGASRTAVFFQIILPSALPDILTGLRTAVGVSYATLVAAEMVASASGIAWKALAASQEIKNPNSYARRISSGPIALIIDGFICLLIKKLTPWQEKTT
ncbi:MAG: ABC transporter permease subunit [Clostridiales bacterium]|nr:ABC transporter permease subunit [Clostridiales bacterium]